MTDPLETQEPEDEAPNEQEQRPNWSAAERFREACDAADAVHAADLNHKQAVCEALRRTLWLVEDYRGEHRGEMVTYLKGVGVTVEKLAKDDVLAIVQHVFARCPKQQRTWHANALKQALAEKRRADDLPAYFKAKSPTQAATDWRTAHPSGRAKAATVEVPLASLKLPAELDEKKLAKIAEKGLPVKLCKKDGKFALLI